MKKIIMMLLGIAFAGAAWAAYGDIYSIIPLSEGGKGYMTGEKVQFRVRLVARNYNTPNPTAYQLVYTGSGTEAEDKVSNPLQLGIVVSGQLRGATITEVKPAAINGDQTVNPYTDLICEYVVQSSDTASLITLALNGSTESAPIIPDSVDAVNDSGYCFINGDKWDLRIEGQTTSASLRFVSSSTAKNAKGFWDQLGATVLDKGLAKDYFVDYNLAQANFLVNSQGPFIVSPLEGEFLGFVSALDGFKLPLLLGASDAALTNSAGFAVKVTSGKNTLYDKPDILFRKGGSTDLEINEGYKYDPDNIYRTATITVKTPDGRVTTGTFTFAVLPDGGVLVHDLDEINAAIGKAEEEEKYPLVLVKANVIALETGDSIALPTPDTNVNVYFSSVNRDEDLFDISAIVPTFGSPYDVVTNFADSNLVYLDPEKEWSDSADDWVIVGYNATNVLTTVEQQLAQFINTNDVAKLVFDAKRKAISLIGRGESEDFPWILDASTNVTAWVDANKKLVINNGLLANSYDIDLVAMTNIFAKCKYTAPANALVKVVNGSTTNAVTSAGWVGANGAYATLADAIAAGEAKVLPGYEVSYDANGATGVMTNSIFAVNKQVTLKSNAFTAVGYDFAGWATNGVDEVAYTNQQVGTNFVAVTEKLDLTAKWTLDPEGVTEVSFTNLTNTIAKTGLQASTLPITIDFTSDVVIPAGAELSAFPSGTGFSGIRYVPEEEGYSTLSVSNGVLYASKVREEVTVDALRLMQHAMGGSIATGKFQGLTEDAAGETIATNIVMFVGDNHKAYFNDDDNVDQMIEAVLAADPRPTTVKLYEVKGAMVTFEAMGGLIEAGVDPLGNAYEGGVESVTYLCLPDPGYELPTVSRTDYTLIGWYDGWTNGVNEVTNKQEIVNYSEHSLYAKWQSTKIHPSETPGEKIIETKEGEDGTIIRPSDTSALPEELILPETDTGAAEGTPLTKIDEKAYAGLRGITKVAVPIYVKEIGARAFYNEKNLGEVTFVQPRDYATLDKVPLKIGDYAFFGSKLESVTIPSTTSSIGSAAFANCANLKEVTILGELTIEGQYPFRNCGRSEEDPLTITLSPRAAADQDFINSLTNGCKYVAINEKYAGEITLTDFVPNSPEVGKVEINFTYSANDVDINRDTVTAVFATSLDKVTANEPMIPEEVRANGSNSYTAVFTMPSGSSGYYRLTVNIEK
ncbi:MAG: leucine-rich repeat protein [Kiritimatiellae bacterium]|nr:leucine-rich repeat protein [Kiritimatiellia bacterium]